MTGSNSAVIRPQVIPAHRWVLYLLRAASASPLATNFRLKWRFIGVALSHLQLSQFDLNVPCPTLTLDCPARGGKS